VPETVELDDVIAAGPVAGPVAGRGPVAVSVPAGKLDAG